MLSTVQFQGPHQDQAAGDVDPDVVLKACFQRALREVPSGWLGQTTRRSLLEDVGMHFLWPSLGTWQGTQPLATLEFGQVFAMRHSASRRALSQVESSCPVKLAACYYGLSGTAAARGSHASIVSPLREKMRTLTGGMF